MKTTPDLTQNYYTWLNKTCRENTLTRNPDWRLRLCTVDLLVLTSFDPLFNEEANRAEPSPSVSVPWPEVIRPNVSDDEEKTF